MGGGAKKTKGCCAAALPENELYSSGCCCPLLCTEKHQITASVTATLAVYCRRCMHVLTEQHHTLSTKTVCRPSDSVQNHAAKMPWAKHCLLHTQHARTRSK